MLQTPCPQLSVIAKVLREKYDVQFASIVRNASVDELRRAEAEVIRVNRLIAKHRRNCPHCTSIFATVTPSRSRSVVLDATS
jgi:hypothetical protein